MVYDTYDEYTRKWNINSPDSRFLRSKFHFQYRNGYDSSCVSTRDATQRRWFLLNDRDRISGPGYAVADRLGLNPISPRVRGRANSEVQDSAAERIPVYATSRAGDGLPIVPGRFSIV